MKQKKRLRKLTGIILLALAICTGLARQFRQLLLPQVTVASLAAGTIIHQDVYPAVFLDASDMVVGWQVDEQGYQYYGENRKASLAWTDRDGENRKEVFKIAGRTQNGDGTWQFTMDIEKLSGELPEDADVSVWMEKESEYDYTLPVSALSMEADGYMIYMVETHQGIFADEQTVQGWLVDVLDQDSVTAAVSSGWEGQVVTYASKPLWDKMQVVIAE